MGTRGFVQSDPIIGIDEHQFGFFHLVKGTLEPVAPVVVLKHNTVEQCVAREYLAILERSDVTVTVINQPHHYFVERGVTFF